MSSVWEIAVRSNSYYEWNFYGLDILQSSVPITFVIYFVLTCDSACVYTLIDADHKKTSCLKFQWCCAHFLNEKEDKRGQAQSFLRVFGILLPFC